jgi:hypothetical protein
MDTNWHRSDWLYKECEWKQGVPAAGQNQHGKKWEVKALRCSAVTLHPAGVAITKLCWEGKSNKTFCLPLVGVGDSGRPG